MEFSSEDLNETDVEREVKIEDSKATISSEIEQRVDCDTFMEMFHNKVNRYNQLKRKVRDMENEIDSLLEKREKDMQVLHSIDSSQQQEQLPEQISRNNAINSVPFEAIETYVQLRKGKDQMEDHEKELADLKEDLQTLGEAAEEIVENYDSFELGEIWKQKVKKDVMGGGELQ